jgi:hypothetical protein
MHEKIEKSQVSCTCKIKKSYNFKYMYNAISINSQKANFPWF